MQGLWQYTLLGLTAGSAYALVALGVVTVFRGSGVLNFAQGAIGMAGTYAFAEANKDGRLPLGPSLVIGVAFGALIGGVFYAVVIRHMARSAELSKVVATLGLFMLLQAVAVLRYGSTPEFVNHVFRRGTVEVFGSAMTYDSVIALGVACVVAIVIWLVFTRTKLGVRATALRDNPAAAAAVGISPHPSGMLTWALGGAVGALGGIALLPLTGLSPSRLALLVIPAFAAGLLARFSAIGLTLGVALGLGIAESWLVKFKFEPGIVKSLPFALILLVLVLGGSRLPTRGASLGGRLPMVGPARLSLGKGIVAFSVLIVLSLVLSPTWSVAITTSAIGILMALSVVVITGYGGQLSLALFALAGVSCLVVARTASSWAFPLPLAVLSGVVVATVLGLLIGAPAVRVRGVYLAIATIGLSLVVENAVFGNSTLTGGVAGVPVPAASIVGVDIDSALHPERYAVFCLLIVAAAALGVMNVRRGRLGRRFLAVRGNERGAEALGISSSGAKLGAFGVSSAIAGLAGALLTYRYRVAGFENFTVSNSILVVTFAILGGVGFVGGAYIAGLIATGGVVAVFFNEELGLSNFNEWLPVLAAIAVIDVMARAPDGLIVQGRAISRLASRAVRLVPHRRRRPVASAHDATPIAIVPSTGVPDANRLQVRPASLEVVGLTVHFGSTCAVNDVSLSVQPGEVVGVIGPNGAGKTSLIDAITGFNEPTQGRILLAGDDMSPLAAFERARHGLTRTFQNLELFDDLTVRENVLAAVDRKDRLAYVSGVLTSGPNEFPPMVTAALEVLELSSQLDKRVADLPQGRRRMVAIARVIAMEPSVVCLDEPAAGLSGPERRVASTLFRRLADDYGMAVLLVEHNIDVVLEICDRLVALDFGKVIATGTTHDVMNDDRVRVAYLGGETHPHSADKEPPSTAPSTSIEQVRT